MREPVDSICPPSTRVLLSGVALSAAATPNAKVASSMLNRVSTLTGILRLVRSCERSVSEPICCSSEFQDFERPRTRDSHTLQEGGGYEQQLALEEEP